MLDPSQTWTVYRDGVGVNHFAAETRDDQTRCGFDLEFMEKREHPITHAACWCHLCFKAMSEGSNQDRRP